MSLVRVIHAWVVAESTQRTRPTDAQHDLLAKPVFAPAGIEAIGDFTFLRRVVLDVTIEQEQWNAADLRTPHLGDAPASFEIHVDLQGTIGWRRNQGERHTVRVECRVTLLLPPVRVQLLPEVSLPVEKPDSDQGEPEITCGFEVVAGKNSKTSRIGWQRLADAELG